MEKKMLQKKEQIWEKIINPERKRKITILLVALLFFVVLGVIGWLFKIQSMIVISLIGILTIPWFIQKILIIKEFFEYENYRYISNSLNLLPSSPLWEYKELKKQKKLLLTSANEEESQKINKKINLLKIWINQIK